MKRLNWFVAMAVVWLGAACTDYSTGNPGYGPGTLHLRLTTPHADDGAMLFEISGPRVDSAVAGNASLRLFTRREGTSKIVGAAVGTLANGAVVALQVSDVSQAAGYSVHVIEVADRQNALRASLAGYALTVSP